MENAILVGDLHVLKKPGMWSGRQEIAGDDEFALMQISDLCREKKADLYLLGDTLDALTNMPRPMVLLKKYLEPLIEAGHKVRYIQGQHEMIVSNDLTNYPWMDLIDGTEHLHGKSFDLMGRKAYALDYFPESFQHLELSKVPEDCEVLFLHGTAAEIVPFNAHFSMDLVKDDTIVFAGDYHEPLDYVHGDGRSVHYTGSMHLRSTSEPREKSVIFLDGSKDVSEFERLPLKTRKIVKLTELDAELYDTTARADVPENIQKPIVLIDRPAAREELHKLAQDTHVYITPAANPDIPTPEEMDEQEDTSDEEILARYISKEEFPVEFQFTLDLLQNPAGDAMRRLRKTLEIEELF